MTNPADQPKKIMQLGHFESDILRNLVLAAQRAHRLASETPEAIRAKEAEQEVVAYCNRIIVRHKGNPRIHAVSPDFEWIIQIPQDQLDAMMRQQAAEIARQAEANPKHVVEMPAANTEETPEAQPDAISVL